MIDEGERSLERRAADARSDVEALRALVGELGDRPEAWARTMRLRLTQRIVQLRAEDTERRKIGDFWSPFGLDACDGRPLYAYRLSDDGFAQIAEAVRNAARERRLDGGFMPALFALWASEWFRRFYRGGGQRWDALADAIGVVSDQTVFRSLSDKGLRLWRREIRRSSGGDRQILATLACEGGFPVAAIEEGGRGWAREVLRAIVGPLLAEPGLDFDRALELAQGQVERLPQSFRDEEILALCADLSLSIVRLRQEAEAPAAAQGIPPGAWLTINRPDWRADLPITTEGSGAMALIDLLMTVGPELVARGSVRVERLIERGPSGWREAVRLHLDGPLSGEGVAGLDASLGRLRAYAHGAFSRALPGELAMVEPPAIGESHWTARAISRSRGVHPVPFATPIVLDLRAGETPVRPIALPGGAPRRGALLVCTIAEEREGRPVLLKVEASGSGGFRSDSVVVQAPVDWPVEALGDGEAADLGSGVGATRLWRIVGRAWATSPEGDRYLIRTGQTADARDRIELVGQQPGWARIAGEIDLFCGSPLVRRSDPRRGQLYIRRIGARDWRLAPSVLPIGHYDIGWREDRVLLDRRRIAVLPASAKLERWNRGASAAYRPEGFEVCRLEPDAEAPVTVQSDGSWRARRVSRPTHRFRAELHWPDLETDPPLECELDFPAEAAIARWDGTMLPNNARFTLAELSDLVALDVETVTMSADLVVPRAGRRSETMTWRIEREMAMSVVSDDLASMLLPAHIDATVRLGMNDGIETFWHLAQFEPELAIDGEGLVAARGVALPRTEVCARAFAAPARERSLGPYSLIDSPNHRPIRMPTSFAGDWLVYLRQDDRVLTRPKFWRGTVSTEMPPTRLGQVMAMPPGRDLDGAIGQLLDEAEADEAVLLITEIVALVGSLRGLPPLTFRILELAAERPRILARMAMLAPDAQRDAVLALSHASPFAWCLVPAACWQDAQWTALRHSLSLVAGTGEMASHFAKQMVDRTAAEIVAREPLLAPLLTPASVVADIESVVQGFLQRAHHRVDGHQESLFRPRLTELLPRYLDRFDNSFLEVLDAPFAAALAVRGQWRPDVSDVRRIKAIARSFPNYFGDAFAIALQE